MRSEAQIGDALAFGAPRKHVETENLRPDDRGEANDQDEPDERFSTAPDGGMSEEIGEAAKEQDGAERRAHIAAAEEPPSPNAGPVSHGGKSEEIGEAAKEQGGAEQRAHIAAAEEPPSPNAGPVSHGGKSEEIGEAAKEQGGAEQRAHITAAEKSASTKTESLLRLPPPSRGNDRLSIGHQPQECHLRDRSRPCLRAPRPTPSPACYVRLPEWNYESSSNAMGTAR